MIVCALKSVGRISGLPSAMAPMRYLCPEVFAWAAALHIAPAARELHIGVACDLRFPRSEQELSRRAR